MNYITNTIQLISPTTTQTLKNMDVLSGSRKFIRKRDSSTDSLKRATLVTPKSNNGSFKLADSTKRKYDNVQETEIARLIKTNSYMKILQSPISTKVSENSKVYDLEQDEKSTNQQSRLTFQKTTVKQNLSKLYHTPKNNFVKEDQQWSQNYRILTSTRNGKKNQKQLILKYDNQSENSSFPQTQRQLLKKGDDGFFSETKVLQSQILILEDENSRLKKQITQLTQQKQQQKRKRYELERQNRTYDEKLKNLTYKQNDTLLNIQKNIEVLYMQVNTIFGFEFQDITDKLNEQDNQLKHEQTLSSSTLRQNPQINIDNFLPDFLSPICSNIMECILAYRKKFEESKLNLSKLEIKQNIMLRNQYEARKLRDELKYLTDKYLVEKNRVQRYKEMYQKLKREFDNKKYSFQIKNSSKNVTQQRRSFNLKSNASLNEEQLFFTLSDASDQQGSPRKKQSLRKYYRN